MFKLRILLIVLLFVGIFNGSYGQYQDNEPQYFEVGKESPNYFFTDVQYGTNKQLSIEDFKGKWLILDCWNRHCGGCITKMPYMDSLKSQYAGKADFLLVGYTGSQYDQGRGGSDDKPIKKLYKRIATMYKLSLPVAFDSAFFHKYDIGACPYIVVINPDGVVAATSFILSSESLESLMMGKDPKLPKVYRTHESDQPKIYGALERKAINILAANSSILLI